MSKRVSHSLLDPWISPPLKRLYPQLRIPAAFPPEGIVLVGHLSAIAAGVGFAFCIDYWWGGLLAALGVAGNHIADVLDGTHARATRQCRNGGELLDHFTDPLSFSYIIVGIAAACGRLDLGLAGVICLYATAVLTNIRAKMTGTFALQSFGPTEFKTLLVILGVGFSGLTQTGLANQQLQQAATWLLGAMIAIGVVQLVVMLISAIREVNSQGSAPDTTEWVTRDANGPAGTIIHASLGQPTPKSGLP